MLPLCGLTKWVLIVSYISRIASKYSELNWKFFLKLVITNFLSKFQWYLPRFYLSYLPLKRRVLFLFLSQSWFIICIMESVVLLNSIVLVSVISLTSALMRVLIYPLKFIFSSILLYLTSTLCIISLKIYEVSGCMLSIIFCLHFWTTSPGSNFLLLINISYTIFDYSLSETFF